MAPLAVTSGDPAGIGPEITARAWRERPPDLPPFFLIDDPDRLAGIARVREIAHPREAIAAFAEALPVLRHEFPAVVRPGVPDTANAQAVIDAIDSAVGFAQSGEASGVVTNPIAKKVLYDGAGFRWPGHTEYLAHLGGVDRTVMMLAAPGLRVVPVTIHIPLADVPAALTIRGDRRDGADHPRRVAIGFRIDREPQSRPVTGLNPHAGEGGAMGREEIETIVPALEELRGQGDRCCWARCPPIRCSTPRRGPAMTWR